MEQHGNDVGFAGEGLSLSHADRFLFDAILRYITLAERPQDKGYIGNLIQREILYRILTSPAGMTLRETVLTGSSSQRISSAINWLRTHYSQPLKMEGSGRDCRNGVSTLHHHFRRMDQHEPVAVSEAITAP
ncbi:AraC-type transcriptional regulator N-terminus [Citrobacter koseri]|uniref:AraC-type transcriptional regulator N-terminus n=1 Tax=Citrobacter koseri TaxID=545 RepID=A0A2X2W9T6_CITKO|nr:AraC-type transcriptional regulator N-terminus [Citrobacter koseri]